VAKKLAIPVFPRAKVSAIRITTGFIALAPHYIAGRRRNFYLNLTLWIVMSTLLIGGVLLVLRAASREMKLSQMKSDFVSNVSHELRTPLASIRVFAS
jgi:signal transduction histidine kinase